ncbi:MAG: histidine--tRNA ligase [Vampirovibrionales bacterium]|nr:histidine--tRNA ligase [Vampirovibrionales bacterium]
MPINAVKGMPDILPVDSAAWQQIEQAFTETVSRAGYGLIRPPLLENTELFERGVGDSTDIVTKEMFTIEREHRRMTLRPEGTAGVVRAFIEHGLSRRPKPVRLAYLGPMFRYERPQAGRQRQFHQAGVELFGVDSAAADVEVIQLAMAVIRAWQIPPERCVLSVNNVGTPEDRNTFSEAIRASLASFDHKICPDCRARLIKNPIRVLDCKVDSCKSLYGELKLSEKLAEIVADGDSQPAFEQTCLLLGDLAITYTLNSGLVRGLDYYTRTVFEITATSGLGSQNAVCGGGRYNQLVAQLGGPPTPAVGFAFGLERILSLCNEFNREAFCLKPAVDIFVASDNASAALQIAEMLRNLGKFVTVALESKPIGKWLEQANKQGATTALLQGENERAAGAWIIKDLQSGHQQVYEHSGLQHYFSSQ